MVFWGLSRLKSVCGKVECSLPRKPKRAGLCFVVAWQLAFVFLSSALISVSVKRATNVVHIKTDTSEDDSIMKRLAMDPSLSNIQPLSVDLRGQSSFVFTADLNYGNSSVIVKSTTEHFWFDSRHSKCRNQWKILSKVRLIKEQNPAKAIRVPLLQRDLADEYDCSDQRVADTLVIEHIDAVKMRSHQRNLTFEDIRRLKQQLWDDTLKPLHNAGVVHCDVGKGNFLANDDLSKFWLIDFEHSIDLHSPNAYSQFSLATCNRGSMSQVCAWFSLSLLKAVERQQFAQIILRLILKRVEGGHWCDEREESQFSTGFNQLMCEIKGIDHKLRGRYRLHLISWLRFYYSLAAAKKKDALLAFVFRAFRPVIYYHAALNFAAILLIPLTFAGPLLPVYWPKMSVLRWAICYVIYCAVLGFVIAVTNNFPN